MMTYRSAQFRQPQSDSEQETKRDSRSKRTLFSLYSQFHFPYNPSYNHLSLLSPSSAIIQYITDPP